MCLKAAARSHHPGWSTTNRTKWRGGRMANDRSVSRRHSGMANPAPASGRFGVAYGVTPAVESLGILAPVIPPTHTSHRAGSAASFGLGDGADFDTPLGSRRAPRRSHSETGGGARRTHTPFRGASHHGLAVNAVVKPVGSSRSGIDVTPEASRILAAYAWQQRRSFCRNPPLVRLALLGPNKFPRRAAPPSSR